MKIVIQCILASNFSAECFGNTKDSYSNKYFSFLIDVKALKKNKIATSVLKRQIGTRTVTSLSESEIFTMEIVSSKLVQGSKMVRR